MNMVLLTDNKTSTDSTQATRIKSKEGDYEMEIRKREKKERKKDLQYEVERIKAWKRTKEERGRLRFAGNLRLKINK